MSEAVTTEGASTADPLKTAADAMALAVQAAKDGAADARAKANEVMPAVGLFFSRLTYTTSYALSYGVVFPALFLARAIPKENAIVHGLIDGGAAARDAVAALGKANETPVAEAAPQPA
ncbi:MAG: hypothetical protein P4L84_37530 [Isosphaeraceae bacterium]|nr:hypothetical protein [Isosphaeraceae bacterium]